MEHKSTAMKILEWFCPDHLAEGIAGDLEEQYLDDVQVYGERIARRRRLWNTLRFFRPSILLRNRIKLINPPVMLANYAKVASRNIMKRKLYSFINAFGLSIALAFGILIWLFIQDERSFDQFHANREVIYRMENISYNTWDPHPENAFGRNCWMQCGLRQALLDDVPEVEFSTAFIPDNNVVVRYGDKVFNESISYADHDFFEMFSFPLLSGNKKTIFRDSKYEIVLTPAIVEKYFGKEDPVGKSIAVNVDGHEQSYIVVAVIESPPANSSIDFRILMPTENRPGYAVNLQRWTNYNTPTFVQLVHAADTSSFQRNLDKLMDKHLKSELERQRRESLVAIPEGVKLNRFVFTPLAGIHMETETGWHRASDPQYSWILGGIATMIMLIACINYISLALTTSAARRTEVGVRKVAGAQQRQLIYQFGFESVMLSLISMVIGIGLTYLFLPFFNQFTGKGIVLGFGAWLSVIPPVCAGSVLVGIVAGSYPALFLSRFRPVAVLKGRFTSKLQAGFTKPLVIAQFALAAFLIISSLVMHQQMEFVMTSDLGFDQEQVLVVPTQAGWNMASDRAVDRYRERLLQEQDIIAVAGATSSFNRGWSRYGFKFKEEHKSSYVYGVDDQYVPLFDMEIVAGRNFDSRIAADSGAVIVNEALVKDMNWTDPLNEHLNFTEDSTSLGAKVIGVVRNFHFQSLNAKIEPMLLSMSRQQTGHLSAMLVKVKPGVMSDRIATLRKAWMDVSPSLPFEYTFLDDDIAVQYESYERWMKIMTSATVFAIIISCLGLFGLSGVNALNRTKEIGIRKVMGAETLGIVLLLNRQYIVLAGVAFAIAAPASWYAMSKWLANFTFAIEMGAALFIYSLLAGLLVSLLTVSYHAIKAAVVNPAETLKHE